MSYVTTLPGKAPAHMEKAQRASGTECSGSPALGSGFRAESRNPCGWHSWPLEVRRRLGTSGSGGTAQTKPSKTSTCSTGPVAGVLTYRTIRQEPGGPIPGGQPQILSQNPKMANGCDSFNPKVHAPHPEHAASTSLEQEGAPGGEGA